MLPDWLKEYLTPYKDIQRNGYSLEELVSIHLPMDHLEALRRLGFLLLRPDSLMNKEATNILDYLEDNYGIVPLEMKILHMSPFLFDALYRFKLHFFGDNVWLHHRISDNNPIAVVLVAGISQEYNSLSEKLNYLKGPSLAVQDGLAFSLRTRFKRLSSFHAVVHTAEDPGAFLYESTLFFTWAILNKSLKRVSPLVTSDFSAMALPRVYRRILLSIDSNGGYSVFQLLIQIKRKILAHLLLHASKNYEPLLLELWQLMEDRTSDLDQKTYKEQRNSFIGFSQAERQPLRILISEYEAETPSRLSRIFHENNDGISYEGRWTDLNQALASLHLLYVNWYLSGHDVYSLDDGRCIFSTLASNNIPLFPWQQTILQAALRSDINRDARWGNELLFPNEV